MASDAAWKPKYILAYGGDLSISTAVCGTLVLFKMKSPSKNLILQRSKH